jgi:hypothetical protein
MKLIEKHWPLQIGNAITLPIFVVCFVLYRKSPPAASTRLHEFCHVDQARRWGTLSYYRRHIWERVKARDLYVRESYVEAPCYDAGRDG